MQRDTFDIHMSAVMLCQHKDLRKNRNSSSKEDEPIISPLKNGYSFLQYPLQLDSYFWENLFIVDKLNIGQKLILMRKYKRQFQQTRKKRLKHRKFLAVKL